MKERGKRKASWVLPREGGCYLVEQDQLHRNADRWWGNNVLL